MTKELPGYRKGLVLGFSVAESFIIICFILLLLLCALITSRNAERKSASYQRARLSQQFEAQKASIESLENLKSRLEKHLDKSKLQEQETFDEYFKELVRKAKDSERLTRLAEENSEIIEAFKELQKKVLPEGQALSPAEVVEEISDTHQNVVEPFLKLKEQMSSEKTVLTDAETFDSLEQLLEHPLSSNELSDMLATCKGQIENYQVRDRELGRGFSYPPCSVDDKGKPDYTFDVAVTDDGMLAKKNYLPKNKVSTDEALLAPVIFDSEVSQSSFLAMTGKLDDYGRKNNCRFFVRLFDNTGPAQKLTYKNHRRIAEQHFYIFDQKDQRLE